MAPTSYPMALAALVPLPFDIVFTILRFWIRSKRNAWGPDDWAMLVNLVRLSQIHMRVILTSCCSHSGRQAPLPPSLWRGAASVPMTPH
jgi:hypothetical protein